MRRVSSRSLSLARRASTQGRRRLVYSSSISSHPRNTTASLLAVTYRVPGALLNVRSHSTSNKPQSDTDVAKKPEEDSVVAEPDHLALAKPLNFDLASKVEGQESQMVTFELEPGQVIRAEAGNLVYMEDGIEMDTNTGGGASSMFRRVITGQNMFVTDYINRGKRAGKVGLGTDVPSKIVRLPLAQYGGSVICQRGAFLAGSHTIDIQTEFTKMMAGFFGGEGFVLQRLTGEGDAFVKASGPLIQRDLKEGETLRVNSGAVVAFSPTVQYDVQQLPGFKNVVFGGQGLFITLLTGPGTVFLQGLPFDRMVDQIARRIPGGRGVGGMPIPIGMGGGGGGGEEGAEGAEGAGDAAADGGGDMAAGAAAAEGSTMAASGGEGDSQSASNLFGDAAPQGAAQSESFQASGASGADASGGGFADAAKPSEPDLGFSEPPPESSGSSEQGWFNSNGGSGDSAGGGGDFGGDGGGDWGGGGDGDGEEGGVVGTLKKLYSFFGGDDQG